MATPEDSLSSFVGPVLNGVAAVLGLVGIAGAFIQEGLSQKVSVAVGALSLALLFWTLAAIVGLLTRIEENTRRR